MNSGQLGKTIKNLRIKNNLTQKEFADKLGVTYQAVSKWENGKNMPDILLLKDISALFNINIDELLTGKKKCNNTINNNKIWIIGVILLLATIAIFVTIIINNNNSNFEFKTITSSCKEFTLTGSAAYNKDKTSIYISNVDYCGKENNIIYEALTCNLYEDYKNTKTKIGSCGTSKTKMTLDEFLNTVQINVNNYVASCKMFTSSSLYLEIQATDVENKTTTYQIPINLEENCQK